MLCRVHCVGVGVGLGRGRIAFLASDLAAWLPGCPAKAQCPILWWLTTYGCVFGN
jgi:hypothetical protein